MTSKELRKRIQPALRFVIRAGFAGLSGLFRWIPWGAASGLGGAIGAAAFGLLGQERRKVLANLEAALTAEASPKDRLGIAKGCFVHFGRVAAECMKLDGLKEADLASKVEVRGFDRIEAALAKGRGILFLTAHFGNWEIMAAAYAARGVSVSVLAAPIYDEVLDRWTREIRGKRGIRTILRGRFGTAKAMIAAIKRNHLLGVLIDQDTRVDGVFVPFFGRPAYTPSGPATLALRYDLPVFVGFSTRLPGGQYRVESIGPIELKRTGNLEEEIRENTASWTQLIEAQVRRYPEQWIWMHNRWKTQIKATQPR